MPKNSFIYALATLSGTIIGVGLFSLPYITAKVGFWVMLFYFIALGSVAIVTALMYGEVTMRTEGLHRLPGYAGKYLGPNAKKLTFFTNIIGFYGALLAYLVVGGQFLTDLFVPAMLQNSYWLYGFTLIFFLAGTLLILFDIKGIAQTELIGLILFFIILIVIFAKGFGSIKISNLSNFDPQHLFLPYGAILFSICGMALIPEVKEILRYNQKLLKKVIPLAILIPIITYLFFIILVCGITGSATSEKALDGLTGILGGKLIIFALIFGILTTFTSYIAMGLTLKKVFWYDFKISKHTAWFLSCFVPLVLFFLGINNFIDIISFTGGIMLAIDSVLVILIYLKAKKTGDKKPAYHLHIPEFISYSIIFLFIIGAIYEIYYFVK